MSQPTPTRRHSEGLKIARLILVLSSISPLFILWAIRGIAFVPDRYFVPFCVSLVILPNLFLLVRLVIALRQRDEHLRYIGHFEDNRPYLLAYLFSMLLPFYRQDFSTLREVLAVSAALSFIVFLFWHLNLHYLNLVFAIFDYRSYTVHPRSTDNPYSDDASFILITRRKNLNRIEKVVALRLTDTVYLERGKWT